MKRHLFALMLAGAAAAPAHSALLWEFSETGTGVVGTVSGTLDLTNAFSFGTFSQVGIAGMASAGGQLAAETTSGISTIGYGISGPAAFGSGSATLATSISTNFDMFLDGPNTLWVEDGYAGEAFTGNMLFSGATFSSLGVSAGDFVYSLLNVQGAPVDTLTVRFADNSVPAPGTLPLLGAAMIGAGWLRSRRRQA